MDLAELGSGMVSVSGECYGILVDHRGMSTLQLICRGSLKSIAESHCEA